MYEISYFADEQSPAPTVEKVEGFTEAEARAAELGKVYQWVHLYLIGWADTDTHVTSFGTNVKHTAHPLRRDRRGKYFCWCGYFAKDGVDLDRHRELAGWTGE